MSMLLEDNVLKYIDGMYLYECINLNDDRLKYK